MRARGSSRLLLFALLGCAACEVAPTQGGPGEPLRPLIYTESPEYTSERARAWEERLLAHFDETGSVDAPPEEVASTSEPAAEAAVPDALIDQPLSAATPPSSVTPPSGEADPFDLTSAEGLAAGAFDAILRQKLADFDRLLIDKDGLMALAGVGPNTAERRIEALLKASHRTWGTFSPRNASEEPADGLASRLEMTEIRLGTPGDVRGKKPKLGDEIVQYWGTEIGFKLKNSEGNDAYEFTLTLPRILRVPSGQWRLAAAPQVNAPFLTYLDAGIHLKPEMLSPEHHEFPMSVGNFWRYRILYPERTDAPADLGADKALSETVQIEVIEVARYTGYRVVTLRRTHTLESSETSTFHFLITPRRLYICDRYCKQHSERLAYVLDHIRLSTPLLIFPLREGMSWTKGGKVVYENARYNTQDTREAARVPAGEFTDALVVHGRTSGGLETRYFKPGVGVVERVVRGNTGTRVEELIEYRVLNTE